MIKFINKNLKNGKKHYRFLIFLILIFIAVVTRLSVYYYEQTKPIYNMNRLYLDMGVPVNVKKIEKTSDVFYFPLTLKSTNRKGYYSAFVGPELKNKLVNNGKVKLTVDGVDYYGKIERISSDIDLDIGLYPVYVSLNFNDVKNMSFFEALAEVDNVKDAIILQRDIVQYDNDKKPYVYRLNGDKAEKVMIELDVVGDELVSLKNGLSVGDIIVVSDSINLYDGVKVSVKNN